MKYEMFDSIGTRTVKVKKNCISLNKNYRVVINGHFIECKDDLQLKKYEIIAIIPLPKNRVLTNKIAEYIDNTLWLDSFKWDNKRVLE
jgi:hypothetical protein